MTGYVYPDKRELANAIKKLFRDCKLGYDYGLFYDDCMDTWKLVKGTDGQYRYKKETRKNVRALDHCKWFGEVTGYFYMGMWFDGEVYRMFYGYEKRKAKQRLVELLDKYGMEIIFPDYTHAEIIPKG